MAAKARRWSEQSAPDLLWFVIDGVVTAGNLLAGAVRLHRRRNLRRLSRGADAISVVQAGLPTARTTHDPKMQRMVVFSLLARSVYRFSGFVPSVEPPRPTRRFSNLGPNDYSKLLDYIGHHPQLPCKTLVVTPFLN